MTKEFNSPEGLVENIYEHYGDLLTVEWWIDESEPEKRRYHIGDLKSHLRNSVNHLADGKNYGYHLFGFARTREEARKTIEEIKNKTKPDNVYRFDEFKD